MKKWYLFYSEKIQQLVGQLGNYHSDKFLHRHSAETQDAKGENLIKLHHVGAELVGDNEDSSFGTQQHFRYSVSVTYTFGYRKKVQRNNEISGAGTAGSAILK